MFVKKLVFFSIRLKFVFKIVIYWVRFLIITSSYYFIWWNFFSLCSSRVNLPNFLLAHRGGREREKTRSLRWYPIAFFLIGETNKHKFPSSSSRRLAQLEEKVEETLISYLFFSLKSHCFWVEATLRLTK